MEFEKQNKFSEGVGKRIIDALKTNKEPEADDALEYKSGFQQAPSYNPSYNNHKEPQYPEYQDNSSSNEEYSISRDYRELKSDGNSSDIDILVSLVAKLPPGVTKQTGAQIIRRTMEAMGIPMNKVLAGAQQVQEELEQDIRSNINSIEEYRAKIKNMDQEIQQFRKKVHELEDIISLFILSENKK